MRIKARPQPEMLCTAVSEASPSSVASIRSAGPPKMPVNGAVPAAPVAATQAALAGANHGGVRAHGLAGILRRLERGVATAVLGASLFLGGPGAAMAQTAEVTTPVTAVTVEAPEARATKVLGALTDAADRLNASGEPIAAAVLRKAAPKLGPPVSSAVALVAGDLEPDAKRWFNAQLSLGNDNFATMDGRYRSDDGATASGGLRFEGGKGPHTLALNMNGTMFTETDRGMRRTDLLEALLSYTRQGEGVLLFDTSAYGVTAGLQATGDFGGAQLQDSWHEFGEGTLLEGRRLGQGLQDTYIGPREYSPVLGAHARGERALAPKLHMGVSAEALAPLGATGVGWAGLGADLEWAGETGPYAQAGLSGRQQWTRGDAFNFSGAPVDGTVFVPRLELGWRENNWKLGLQWARNPHGTQTGFGDLDADHVFLTFTLGGRGPGPGP